jgi:hypothetical protein
LLVLSGAPDSASIGGVPTVVDGSYTWSGWLRNAGMIGLFGAAGAAAGLFFLFVVRKGTAPAYGMEEQDAQSARPFWRSAALATAAAATIGTAVAIPIITKDRSCHNTLRDGRQSIGQEASFDLRVGSGEWRSVAQEVEAFGRRRGWSILADVRPEDDFQWFQISMCQEPGTNIHVDGIPEQQRLSFGVYQPQGGTSWREPFVELYLRIRQRWPGRIEFTGDVGQRIEPPGWVPLDQRPDPAAGAGRSLR